SGSGLEACIAELAQESNGPIYGKYRAKQAVPRWRRSRLSGRAQYNKQFGIA
ncbi:hypothetical protein LTR41_011726, partial [Exophiala xenobiotica]